MATRGIVRLTEREAGVSFNEHPEKVHTQIYHHYDSYPDHLGVGLAKFLSDIRVVNGLNKDESTISANGIGCLAAQVLTHLKLGRHYGLEKGDKIQEGNVYLDWPGTERCDIEYTYYIWAVDGKDIWISIFSGGLGHNPNCEFVGKPEKLLEKYDKERN